MKNTLLASLILWLFALTACTPAPAGNGIAEKASSEPSATKSTAEPAKQIPFTQDDLHAPFYPGATVDVNQSIFVNTETEKSVICIMTSVDKLEDIVKFYEEKIPGIKFQKMTVGESVNYIGDTTTKDGGKIGVTAQQKTPSDHCIITVAYGKS